MALRYSIVHLILQCPFRNKNEHYKQTLTYSLNKLTSPFFAHRVSYSTRNTNRTKQYSRPQ